MAPLFVENVLEINFLIIKHISKFTLGIRQFFQCTLFQYYTFTIYTELVNKNICTIMYYCFSFLRFCNHSHFHFPTSTVAILNSLSIHFCPTFSNTFPLPNEQMGNWVYKHPLYYWFPWRESKYHQSVKNTKLNNWLGRNFSCEFKTESTSAVNWFRLMGFLACLICCCS